MKPSFVTPIIEKVARDMGLEVHIEPQGYVGIIVLPDGRKRYFRGASFDLNTLGATEVAKDKAYAAYFLGQFGYPVPEGETFFTDRWCQVIESDRNPDSAYRYVRSQLGWPVIVKPNSKSRGVGVFKAHNKRELQQAIRSFEKFENVFLVQRVVQGKDYRIVVLDREVISAYERRPLAVIGDGVSTAQELLLAKQQEFRRVGRDTTIPVDDVRITNTLRRAHLSRESVIPDGDCVQLLPNANLSSGGDAVDVTDSLHNKWKVLATRIASDMNLRYVGIDLIADSPPEVPPNQFVVLEINAAAGLDNYAMLGDVQRTRVEAMYRKVVAAMLK